MVVWDLPLRLFHWGLAAAVIGAVISGKAEILWLHERFGLAVMGLVAFRLFWGFLGGHYARFGQFLVVPTAAVEGLRRLFDSEKQPVAGHSAHGGYAVLGLLAVTGFMAVSGAFSNDDVLFEGPLAHVLPHLSDAATNAHEVAEKFLFLILFLHLAAILIYKFVKRRNLTMAMVKGRVDTDPSPTGPDGGISVARCVAGLLLLFLCVAAAQSLSLLRPAMF